MHNPAERAIRLPAQLPFDTNVLTAHGPKALDQRVDVELGVLEAWHEAVAALAHPADLRTVEGQVELIFVGLSDACGTKDQQRRSEQ